jgi:hypothetical protein
VDVLLIMLCSMMIGTASLPLVPGKYLADNRTPSLVFSARFSMAGVVLSDLFSFCAFAEETHNIPINNAIKRRIGE